MLGPGETPVVTAGNVEAARTCVEPARLTFVVNAC
jgi:hypothetical protein